MNAHRLARRRRRPVLTTGAAVLLALGAALPLAPAAHAATGPVNGALTRYPYLTDSIQSSVTVNWATDRSAGTGSVSFGPPGDCGQRSVAASRQDLVVPPANTTQYQWKAVLPVSPDARYCYRVQLAGADLLGGDASPEFTSQVAAGSTAPFSFAVFGDWGQAYAGGENADQANVLAQIANSGARFAVMTGDTGYPGGTQKEYGDLRQSGVGVSAVFGPDFWAVPGRSVPVFNVTGNHGFTNGAVQVLNWPEGNAAATSGGKYLMENYPSINGSTAKSYPSMWYAVDAGPARIYALTAAWADQNAGSSSPYAADRAAHWLPSSPEYQWLAADLAAHPNAVKIAFWHYPLRADSSGQPDDTFLQGGTGTLEGLLNQNNVKLAFNGHAHGYQRNAPDPGGLVTYVVGNGGAALGGVSGCKPTDLYAIGSSGTHCGAAPAGLPNSRVFGFVKITVNDHTVTVTPTDSLGNTYDIQTYTYPGSTGGPPAPAPRPSPGTARTRTFVATQDAMISATAPTTTFGTRSRLVLDRSPLTASLLQFSVSGLTGCSVTRAVLRLTVGRSTGDDSGYGGDVYATGNGWRQSTLTWRTAPAAGATPVARLRTAVLRGRAYQFDVTRLVTGNGTVSLYLRSPSSDNVRYYSREGGTAAQAPQLLVTC